MESNQGQHMSGKTGSAAKRKRLAIEAAATAVIIPELQGERIWEMLPRETGKSYSAFKTYKNMPAVERTVSETYRRERKKPDAKQAAAWFYDWSRLNDWVKRANAHDVYLDALTRQAELEDRRTSRRRRRLALHGLLGKATSMLGTVDPKSVRFGDVAQGIAIAVRELRNEYDEAPQQQAVVTLVNGGTAPIAALAMRSDDHTDEQLVEELRRITRGDDDA